MSNKQELEDLVKGITGKDSMWAVVHWASKDQKRFDELMEYIYQTENKRLSAVASWPLGKIGELKPDLFNKHHLRIIDALRNHHYHSAVLRNLIRNYQFIPIPEEIEGELYSLCFNYILNPNQPAAVRAFSITVCGRICEKYPELGHELRIAIEEHGMEAEPALRVRSREILKKIS